MGKLPYIPDKRMYAAVMGACSYVKETGWFNRGTQIYADKYDCDVEKVREYVRIAQRAGQKASNKKNPRKYMWFAVEYSMGAERNGVDHFEDAYAAYEVRRGVTARSVQNTMSKNDDYVSEYKPCHWFGRVVGFDTKEAAENQVVEWITGNNSITQDYRELCLKKLRR